MIILSNFYYTATDMTDLFILLCFIIRVEYVSKRICCMITVIDITLEACIMCILY